MKKIKIGYASKLNNRETINSLNEIKVSLFASLIEKFNLTQFDSGLITERKLWLNDDFKLTQRAIDFDIKTKHNFGELLISNNKWRRYFLHRNNFAVDEGVITEFNCVRRNIEPSNTKSIIHKEIGFDQVQSEYSMDKVNFVISEIYRILKKSDKQITSKYKELSNNHLSKSITFIKYSQLRNLYPLLNLKERIDHFGQEHGTFVLTNFIKNQTASKEFDQHSNDVFDFDTYVELFVYNNVIETSVSLAYASYQVGRDVLKKQNIISREGWKSETGYNHLIKKNELPRTITAGIYTNAVSMMILEKEHVAEVHASVWDDEFVEDCEKNNIDIFL
ncbi:hypothetical protein [Spiroplasma endosymbiont of Othius punctulatus]|uniref:hypothetical protein n=1 Tax=Spiroplasma endosymbiont of Othius punctulatus TaxID=3066289 RepID=UPI0030CE33A6